MSFFRRLITKSQVRDCGFCHRAQGEVHKLVAGPDVAICDECVALSAAILGEDEGGTGWAQVLGQMLASCVIGTKSEPLIEPLAHAASIAAKHDPKAVRAIIELVSARDSVTFAQARLHLYTALGPRSLTARDAISAIDDALLIGDLDRAVAIEPVTSAQGDVGWQLQIHLCELLRAPLSAPDLASRLADVVELHRGLDEESAEVVLGAGNLTEAYANVRVGNFGAALARYARYRSDPALRPWHAIAIGDALDASGDRGGALEIWTRVAQRRAWDPHWPDLAGERLSGATSAYR